MTLDLFIFLLLGCSALTGLITEGIKMLLDEYSINYYPNTLAGIVSLIASALVIVAFITLNDAIIDSHTIVYAVGLFLSSWLSAMLGYDKVIQTISQLKG